MLPLADLCPLPLPSPCVTQATLGMIYNILGEADEEAVVAKATYVRCKRFDALSAQPLDDMSSEMHAILLQTWAELLLADIAGFPLWEAEVFRMLQRDFSVLAEIFRNYSSRSIMMLSSDLTDCAIDLEEFHDLVDECELTKEPCDFAAMYTHVAKANAAGDDTVLELSEFISMLMRIADERANSSGKVVKVVETSPTRNKKTKQPLPTQQLLPKCFEDILNQVEALGRKDDPVAFRVQTMTAPDMSSVMEARRAALVEWWEATAEGAEKLSLERWMNELQRTFVVSSLSVDGVPVRFSESQARFAFCQSASELEHGLAADSELFECVARCGIMKYRAFTEMSPAVRADAFVQNMLDEADEERVITSWRQKMQAEADAPA